MSYPYPPEAGAWPLGDIMAAIREDLGALLPEDLPRRRRDGEGTPAWYEGRAQAMAHGAPLRYVWYPGDVAPGAPFKGDIGEHTAEATGDESVFVHSWGYDRPTAWALRHNLIAAARKRFGADCKYNGCQWIEPADTTLGFGYVTRLAFAVPIIGTTVRIAEPTAATETSFIVINGSETQACGG